MAHITTRQRDLIQILINSENVIGISTIADQMGLSARQVQYDLVQIRHWLKSKNTELLMKPGVGVKLTIDQDNKQNLVNELHNSKRVQLILSLKQRQQLLIFLFLIADDSIILNNLQYLLQVSRTTILKDIESVEEWILNQGAEFLRRQNYGFQMECTEQKKRELITRFLWSEDCTFDTPLLRMSHMGGLEFDLDEDAEKLPILGYVQEILQTWNTKRNMRRVTFAEAQLGGRYTDDAVLFLSLVFTLQADRVARKHQISLDSNIINMVNELPAWNVAVQISKKLANDPYASWPDSEIAYLTMHLISATRNERWPGDLDMGAELNQTIDELLAWVAEEYNTPNITRDKILRDGIVVHIIPAIYRKKFNLWFPTPKDLIQNGNIDSKEHKTAEHLTDVISSHMGVSSLSDEIENIALLLQASVIRERSNEIGKVIVVCPSGMATAQLLVARLKAHLPRLRDLQVVSLRDIHQKEHFSCRLIITTVPLVNMHQSQAKIIQVHPLLLPEDIERITRFLNEIVGGDR